MIESVHSVLRRVCCNFAVPGEKLCAGQARVVLSFWDYEERRVAGLAGAAWVRRQRELSPEPTVLLGFESKAEFGASPEGSLLYLSGIVYVALPVVGHAADIIQNAIDVVRTHSIGPLDAATAARNAHDLVNTLLDWCHTLKSFRIQILNATAKTAPGRTAEESAIELGILLGIDHDSIDRRTRSFLHHTAGCQRYSGQIGQCTARVAALLGSASALWGHIIAIAAAPEEEAQAARAHPLLVTLSGELDAIDAGVVEMVYHLSILTGRPSS